MQDTKVHYYKNVKNISGSKLVPIETILYAIKHGGHSIQDILEARKYEKKDERYSSIKQNKIPCFAINAKFSKNGRSHSDIESLTGMIYGDVDGIDNPEDIKKQLSQFNFVYACWVSLSQKGVGFIVKCDNLNKDNFLETWHLLNKITGLEFDSKTKNMSRVTNLSYDPNIYISQNCVPLNAANRDFKNINIQSNGTLDNLIINAAEKKISENAISTVETHIQSSITESEKYKLKKNTKKCMEEQLGVRFTSFLPEEEYKGEKFITFEDGKDCCKIFLKPIEDGKRSGEILAIFINLFLINKHLDISILISVIMNINKKYCITPLQDKEVYNIVKWVIKNSDTIQMRDVFKKKIWINPYLTISNTEKRTIIAEETAKLRVDNTFDKIKNAVITLLKNGIKPKREDVAKHLNVSLRTVATHWKDIKHLIKMNIEDIETVEVKRVSISNNLSKIKKQEIILKNKWNHEENYLNDFSEVMSEYNDVKKEYAEKYGGTGDVGVLNREVELVG